MLKIKINGKECYCEKEVFEYIVRTDEIKEGLQARLKLYEDNEKYLNEKIEKAINYIKSQMKEEYVHTDYVYDMIKILEETENE